jgi:hypothetical protein
MLLAALFPAAALSRPPARLTADHLVGVWRYGFGSSKDGWISFGAEGHYCASHEAKAAPSFAGLYEVRGGEVVLHECWIGPDGSLGSPGLWVFEVKCLEKWPTIRARTPNGTEVVFSGRRRPPE